MLFSQNGSSQKVALMGWEMLICHLYILQCAVRGHRVAWYPTGLGVL